MDESTKERLKALRATLAEQVARAAMDPMWRQPGWVNAKARVRELFPSSDGSLNPDKILDAASADGISFTSLLIYDPWRADPTGWGTKPWEQYTKAEILDMLFAKIPPSPGPVWVITSDCAQRRSEPRVTVGEQLRQFVLECDCDLSPTNNSLFIWQTCPRVSIVHHGGALFNIVMTQDQDGPARNG